MRAAPLWKKFFRFQNWKLVLLEIAFITAVCFGTTGINVQSQLATSLISATAPKNCDDAIKKALGKKDSGTDTSKLTGTVKGMKVSLDKCYGAVLKPGKKPSSKPEDYKCVGRSGTVKVSSKGVTAVTTPSNTAAPDKCPDLKVTNEKPGGPAAPAGKPAGSQPEQKPPGGEMPKLPELPKPPESPPSPPPTPTACQDKNAAGCATLQPCIGESCRTNTVVPAANPNSATAADDLSRFANPSKGQPNEAKPIVSTVSYIPPEGADVVKIQEIPPAGSAKPVSASVGGTNRSDTFTDAPAASSFAAQKACSFSLPFFGCLW